RAHGYGLATGPSNQGEYSGEWSTGFETCGLYIWPSGNSYAGSWCKGKRHGFGIQVKGKWVYRGGFTGGFCGRYGVKTSLLDKATFEGTWHLNQFDGYGVELKSNGSFYAGTWKKNKRHGLGVSQTILSNDSNASADNMTLSGDSNASMLPVGELTENSPNSTDISESTNASLDTSSPKLSTIRSSASNSNLASSTRVSKKALLGRALMKRLKKQHSTSDTCKSPQNLYTAFLARKLDFKGQETPTETYAGQWKENVRFGLGMLERTDGSSYTGEWADNMRNGLGVTHFADGSMEEGRYRGDKLVLELNRKNRLQMLRHVKVRDCLEEVIYKAKRMAQEAKENAAETAYTRAENAREVAITAETQAYNARHISDKARYIVRQLAPDFNQPGQFDFLAKNRLHGPPITDTIV
ncbi:Junctophilin-1, partial [Cichlidogyrus casuarinus]